MFNTVKSILLNRDNISRDILLFLILFSMTSCNRTREKGEHQGIQTPKINLAVAANMQFAMEELTADFTDSTGIRCEITLSSSGKLTAQIKQGAPFDLFLSANMKYPDEVFASGFASTPPKVYAFGKLVLWTADESLDPSIEQLQSESIRHIAMANPETAPYGQAAYETLINLQLLDQLNPKLVFGESIAQTNQFILTRSADLGFTAQSVVLSPELKNKGKWSVIDPDLYRPIGQGVVVIRHEKKSDAAAIRFYDYLSTPGAKSILTKYGYSTPE